MAISTDELGREPSGGQQACLSWCRWLAGQAPVLGSSRHSPAASAHMLTHLPDLMGSPCGFANAARLIL